MRLNKIFRGYVSRIAFLAALAVLLAGTASAQSLEQQVQELRAEMQRLREELDSVRAEIRRGNPTAQAAQEVQEELTPEEALPLIQAQLEEHSRTKVESNSKFPLRLFGTIVSNTILNTGEPNWLDIGNVVMPQPAGLPTGSFTSTLRQSRVGAILDGPAIGSMRTSGLLAIDFFGGMPNFQTGEVHMLPRLLYAYMRIESPRTAFQVGQDHMILAPKNPTSLAGLAFPIMFRTGNLYLRVPQVRAERVLASGAFGEIRAVGGITAPVGGDNPTTAYVFVPPNLAGERSRRPGYQTRFSWQATPAGPYEEPAWEFGASGHYSRERYLTGVSPSWAASVDFDATAGPFGVGGEFFAGRNIDAFGASMAQIAKSRGGFVEARIAATRRLDFNGGFGSDRLYDLARFPAAPVNLHRNSSIFGNTIYQLIPELAISLEYRRLETKPRVGAVRKNDHFNLTFAYSF